MCLNPTSLNPISPKPPVCLNPTSLNPNEGLRNLDSRLQGEIPEDGMTHRLGFRGLGFRVWGLGFGVWGLGFRVPLSR